MFENLKEKDIITIKLANGEEILCKFVSFQESGLIPRTAFKYIHVLNTAVITCCCLYITHIIILSI